MSAILAWLSALTSEKRLMISSACLRSVRKARQQRFLYVSKLLLSSPPIAYTKSGVRTKGAHSRLKPWIGEGVEGGRERGMEGVEGGREGERNGGSGGREGGREEWREWREGGRNGGSGGREGGRGEGREGGRERGREGGSGGREGERNGGSGGREGEGKGGREGGREGMEGVEGGREGAPQYLPTMQYFMFPRKCPKSI